LSGHFFFGFFTLFALEGGPFSNKDFQGGPRGGGGISLWRLNCMRVAPSCGSSVSNLLLVAFLAPRMLMWLLDFWKHLCCSPLAYQLLSVVTERWIVTRGTSVSSCSYVSGSFMRMRINLIMLLCPVYLFRVYRRSRVMVRSHARD